MSSAGKSVALFPAVAKSLRGTLILLFFALGVGFPKKKRERHLQALRSQRKFKNMVVRHTGRKAQKTGFTSFVL